MSLQAELFSSLTSLTTNQAGPLAGSSRHFYSSGDVVSWNIKPSHVESLPCHCSTTSVVAEELPAILAEDSPLSYPFSPPENAEQPVESFQEELLLFETEYIDSLAAEIQECSHVKDLTAGKEIHSLITICGLDADRYLGNLLVLMYGSCGAIEEAEAVYQKIPQPNIYSGNIMINAYVNNNELEKARNFFDGMLDRNGASWNAIISALAKNGCGKDALKYYRGMLAEGFQPNVITCVSAIDACADAAALSEGMMLHSAVIAYGFYDMIVGTALINMYGQCGNLESARDIFRRFPYHDAFSWTAMISACVNNGCNEEALVMFHHMPKQGLKPTRSTYLSILNACGNLMDLSKGYEVHAQMLLTDFITDIKVENALVNLYGRCQSLQDSTRVFRRMLQRNFVTWTTMIAAHSLNNLYEEALELFYEMQENWVNPNNYSITIVFDVCANMRALEEGRRVHKYGVCAGILFDFIASIALINMYGKCRSLEDARAVFRSSEEHGVLVWNAMLAAYAMNGEDTRAWVLLEEMQSKRVKPNKATYNIIDNLEPRQFL
ncbi:hypothetical protein GOP47_0026169 [Adiantum capillus-veneris]|uniref:Pentatricopeptide repeat-containing protein n=1 Tax=Adiantum capillus-veneris TaxID=13818 RepID=A0A9D4U2P6_ADICA|nr:hypothetical protein GOP47_0026169 [Adiantum capillus-veneris]